MNDFPAFAELRDLVTALCEETITPAQVQRLEELLLAHPEAEACYIQLMSLHADLVRHFGALPSAAEQSLRGRIAASAADRTGRLRDRQLGGFVASYFRRPLVWGAGALAVLAAGLLLALLPPRGSRDVRPSGEPGAEPLDNSVAVLLQAPGAEWGESSLPTRAGAALGPGRLRLNSGFAQIEFYSGATVILEGPADFQLISSSEAYCTHGKLRAIVPPQAQGFTIGSPKLSFVDRGTEFGLRVGAGGQTEVHVFQGRVEVHKPGAGGPAAAPQELTTGRGLRVDGPGPASPIASDPAAFRTARDLATRLEDQARRRQRDWLAASAALRQDPSLVVYYPFQAEQPWSRTLRDEARGRQQPADGAIVGCAWVTGRWPGKQGLEFRQVSDRVRFHVPGALESLTLMAWVRVDALPNHMNSLFMTDGWDDGAPHWHISQAGKIELGVRGVSYKGGGAHYYSPAVFTPDRLGQWVHLAVVLDRDARQVTHYVDGQPVAQEPLAFAIPLRVGDVELGNWTIGPRRFKNPIRYFRGCMDEFLLFGRALSAAEVARLYEQGRPPP